MTKPAPIVAGLARALAITLVAGGVVALLGSVPAWSQHIEPVRWRPMHVWIAAWAVLLLALLPRDRWSLAMLASASVARFALFLPAIHLHADKAYALMDEARGMEGVNVQYGDVYAAACSWVGIIWGFVPDVSQRVDAVAGVLTAVLVAQAVRQLTSDVGIAAIACLWMALDPMHVAMSSTEERMVLVTLLQAAFVAGAVRRDAWGEVLAGVSAGLLAHTRPEQGLVAAVMVVGLIAQRAWTGVGLASALLIWRLLLWAPALGGLRSDAHVLYLDVWMNPGRIMAWAGRDGALVALDPTRTPIGLCLFALAGALRVRRDRRGGLWLALLVVGSLLYAPQPAIADRLRFELPVQVALVGLAALGLARLGGWARLAALVGVLVTFLPARSPYPPYAWQREYQGLRRAVTEAPAGAVVRYDDTLDSAHHVAEWANARSAARWAPLSAGVAPTDWRWVGTAEFAIGRAAPELAGRLGVDVESFTPEWGGLEHYGPWDTRPLTIGLYGPAQP